VSTTAGVNDKGDKLFTGVNDTRDRLFPGDKFIASFNDTGNH
jgi:hypothetical protein